MGAPADYDELKAHIVRRHDDLSARLRTIATFAVQYPNDVALNTISVLAEKIGVQPSAIVRFANNLGYDGFTDMQRVFRTRLVSPPAPSYRERISQLRRGGKNGAADRDTGDVLAEFVSDDIAALESLYQAVPFEQLNKAVSLLAAADTIYLFAQGRSFPVAYYLDYGLTRLELRSHLLDGVGGIPTQRTRAITKRDAVIIASFKDYVEPVVEIAADLAARGIPLIVITDNAVGPFARFATVSFDVGEPRERPFKSLVAPICLAQSIVVALGYHLTARPGDKNARQR